MPLPLLLLIIDEGLNFFERSLPWKHRLLIAELSDSFCLIEAGRKLLCALLDIRWLGLGLNAQHVDHLRQFISSVFDAGHAIPLHQVLAAMNDAGFYLLLLFFQLSAASCNAVRVVSFAKLLLAQGYFLSVLLNFIDLATAQLFVFAPVGSYHLQHVFTILLNSKLFLLLNFFFFVKILLSNFLIIRSNSHLSFLISDKLWDLVLSNMETALRSEFLAGEDVRTEGLSDSS